MECCLAITRNEHQCISTTWMNPGKICSVKDVRHKRPHIVWFHLCVPGINRTEVLQKMESYTSSPQKGCWIYTQSGWAEWTYVQEGDSAVKISPVQLSSNPAKHKIVNTVWPSGVYQRNMRLASHLKVLKYHVILINNEKIIQFSQ